MGSQIRISDKKTTRTSKNTKKGHGNIFRRIGKSTTTTTKKKLDQKVQAKEGKLKRYRDRTKQCGQNRTLQNSESKFSQQVGGE